MEQRLLGLAIFGLARPLKTLGRLEQPLASSMGDGAAFYSLVS